MNRLFGESNTYALATYPYAPLTIRSGRPATDSGRSMAISDRGGQNRVGAPLRGNLEYIPPWEFRPPPWEFRGFVSHPHRGNLGVDFLLKWVYVPWIKEKDMTKMKTPTVGMLEEVMRKYDYDSVRGKLINRETGKEPTALISYRYLGCNVRGEDGKWRILRVHHMIWYLEYGVWPTKNLDHIDGNRLNNHISNLRECTQRENSTYYNQKKSSTSKYIGVRWHKGKAMWRAQVSYKGKTTQLKESVSEEKCARAYDEFLIKIGLDPVNFTDYGDSNSKESLK